MAPVREGRPSAALRDGEAGPPPAPAGPRVAGLPLDAWPAPSMGRLRAPAHEVAQDLLGMVIVRHGADGACAGRIVETEAYGGPEDLASHARAGMTRRTRVMFGRAGRAYVYLVYGMHHCLNVVCGPEGHAGAVLIRALEPLAGVEAMRARRGAAAGPDARLAAGPARLCKALDIDRRLDGLDLLRDERLRLVDVRGPADDRATGGPGLATERIVMGPRIGVDYAGGGWAARPWRFGFAGHPSLSRPFPSDG